MTAVLDALDRVADFVDECAPSLLDPEQMLADRDALRELREALADPLLTMVCDHSSLSDPVFRPLVERRPVWVCWLSAGAASIGVAMTAPREED